MIYSNGNVYEGEFIDGKENEQGKMIYLKGLIYEGEFKI
jgi:hypothetical protein